MIEKRQIILNGIPTNYSATTDGKIFNEKTGKELKGTLARNEYRSVQLTVGDKIKTVMVHRLVAEAFLLNPDNFPIVDHIDRDKMNNDVSNLRWVSSAKNAQNKNKIGCSSALGASIKNMKIDSNEWVTIDEDFPQYKINKHGEVINLKMGRYIKGSRRNGYVRVNINGHPKSIHRIVYEKFVGEIPNGYVIDHIDGQRDNNDVTNLRLITQSENMYHAQENGHNGQRPVIQYDFDKRKITEYSSIAKAARAMNVTNAAIRRAIVKGGSSCGYKWAFKNDDCFDDSLTAGKS